MPRRSALLPLVPAALALTFLPVAPVMSRGDPSGLCLRAASDAAAATGVPYDVLLAISMVETGRNDQPWPWTVNVGGDGHWFDDIEDATAHVEDVLNQGLTNVDLGCFQLNYRWHGAGFASIADMLDPGRNAAYAAEFLASHYADSGDWATAAAAYHSATPEYAEIYRGKFETVYASLGGATAPAASAAPAVVERENRFPLLVAGSAGRNGSLFPGAGGGTRLIGAP